MLCIAPAGSGKTTTLVARVAWLVATGAAPATIAAITFNARAAEELRERVAPALEPLRVAPDAVRVRTFHALGLEILRDAGRTPSLAPRDRILRQVLPDADPATRRRLDDAFSRLKLDLGVTVDEIARDPAPGPVARAFVAYERALASAGVIDFDDLVAGALRALEGDPALLARWRTRSAHLLVDEVQDVDRSQLRLALLLAAPANRIFLVGDDDQSIYGWRLADVRRVLGLAADLPGLRRVDLAVNYRCPAPVLACAVRLVEHNQERFAKSIRPGPDASGRLILAPAPVGTDPLPRLLAAWPADDTTRAVLARTRRELLPAVAACLAGGIAFRADGVPLPLEDARVDGVVAAAASSPSPLPIPARVVAAARAGGVPPPAASTPDDPDPEPAWTDAEIAAAVTAWAVRLAPDDDLATAIADARARLAELRRPDAPLTLATAHATKGLEWDHVAVLGMTEGRFPSARSLADAADPARALAEERRLAYVAWTRARRTLTLVFDPGAPSPFLREAFDAAELNPGGVSTQVETPVG